MSRRTSKAAPASKPTAKKRPGRPPRSSKGEEAAQKVPDGVRVIKRYGNRRLYDAQASRAITMRDLEAMVRRGEDLRVIDGDTGEDLTRRTLFQLLLEQDNALQLDIMPVELLRLMIQARTHEAAGEAQEMMRRASAMLLSGWTQAGKAATEMWRTVAPTATANASDVNPMAELERLQKQMAELASRMMGRR